MMKILFFLKIFLENIFIYILQLLLYSSKQVTINNLKQFLKIGFFLRKIDSLRCVKNDEK